MAMVLTHQKPTRRNRIGEVLEGLPGSTKSMVCVERSTQELGRPTRLLFRVARSEPVGETERKVGQPKAGWESDQPIVLSDGSAVHMQHLRCWCRCGEGADRNTEPAQETLTGHGGPAPNANLTASHSTEG